eukprot:7340011-Prymnesium_polylepis.1
MSHVSAGENFTAGGGPHGEPQRSHHPTPWPTLPCGREFHSGGRPTLPCGREFHSGAPGGSVMHGAPGPWGRHGRPASRFAFTPLHVFTGQSRATTQTEAAPLRFSPPVSKPFGAVQIHEPACGVNGGMAHAPLGLHLAFYGRSQCASVPCRSP